MSKLNFFNKIIFFANSLFAALLLLSFLLPYISPNSMPELTILSLFVPALFLINFTFVLYWILKLKKQFILSFLALTLGWFFTSPLYKISDNTSSYNSDLKVLSFNVKAFEYFDNAKDKNGFDFLADQNLDILVLQEYYQSKKIRFSFPYKYLKFRSKKNKFGMAIYSKYRIVNTGSLNLKSIGNNIIFADIIKDKDTIRIYNAHFESLRIKPNEENFGEENPEKLIQRATVTFKKQATQTNLFLKHEKQWKGKKIICGDFNNTAYSWMYQQISKNKKDAFIEAGKGFGKTYKYWFPLRIDFILTDKEAIINQFSTLQKPYSDHFPIRARINW
jgi:endonuclease/exonuclease/phosphatase family metal-dependent hydrolase